jgi:hypothetical protein
VFSLDPLHPESLPETACSPTSQSTTAKRNVSDGSKGKPTETDSLDCVSDSELGRDEIFQQTLHALESVVRDERNIASK